MTVQACIILLILYMGKCGKLFVVKFNQKSKIYSIQSF